jgi:hypothetical protein
MIFRDKDNTKEVFSPFLLSLKEKEKKGKRLWEYFYKTYL